MPNHPNFVDLNINNARVFLKYLKGDQMEILNDLLSSLEKNHKLRPKIIAYQKHLNESYSSFDTAVKLL